MKVLILAAGNSKRLRPLTNDIPKTLLELKNGCKMLDHILDNCYQNNLKDFYLVTGHGHQKIKAHMAAYTAEKKDVSYQFIYNKEYDTKGNIYSFYLAQKAINDDYILIHSDVIFHPRILAKVLSHPQRNVIAVDDIKNLSEEEMKVLVRKDNTIKKIHKSLNPKEAHGEHIGVSKISAQYKDRLLKAIEDTLALNEQVYYEDSLQKLIDDNIPFYSVSTEGLPCMEIDTHEDLLKAKKLIKLCQ